MRSTRLTSLLGLVLLVGVPIMFLTGFLSFLAYDPWLPGNSTKPFTGWLTAIPFHWPTHPHWLYRLTQGVHVTLGTVLVPVLLAKLWSVIPKLFEWPPIRSIAHALDRASLLLLVGSGVFTFATGLMNTQYWYRFPGSFYQLHFWAAWVFVGAFVAHAAIKLPLVVRTLRERSAPEVEPAAALTPAQPALTPTITRRGALAAVAGASAVLFVTTVGQSIGGSFRRVSLLAPRGGVSDVPGPSDFPVNITAAIAGIAATAVGSDWRLEVRGAPGSAPMILSREQLLALPMYTAHLPIACVEGWSTPDQRWEGVRLRDLARLAGASRPGSVLVESLQQQGQFSRGRLAGNQIADPDSLLALRVNGADLSMDHGYPARIIVPALPGVRNTKWVRALTFES